MRRPPLPPFPSGNLAAEGGNFDSARRRRAHRSEACVACHLSIGCPLRRSVPCGRRDIQPRRPMAFGGRRPPTSGAPIFPAACGSWQHEWPPNAARLSGEGVSLKRTRARTTSWKPASAKVTDGEGHLDGRRRREEPLLSHRRNRSVGGGPRGLHAAAQAPARRPTDGIRPDPTSGSYAHELPLRSTVQGDHDAGEPSRSTASSSSPTTST